MTAAVAVGAVLSACGGGASEPKTIAFRGDVTLHGVTRVRGDLVRCVGVGPFADLKAGTKVSVTTPAGRTIAAGTIRYGLGTNLFEERLDECTFRFRVGKVPRVPSYLVKIGHLNPQPVTQDQVVLGRGTVEMDVTDTGAQPTTPAVR